MPETFARANTANDITPRARRWVAVRMALGVAQMAGAAVGVVLLAATGVTTWTLAVVLATGVLTTISVLLFGSWRGR